MEFCLKKKGVDCTLIEPSATKKPSIQDCKSKEYVPRSQYNACFF